MSILYSATAVAVGGRSGTVRSDDGLLNVRLALPTEMGGKGGATNPEQLFAAGYAACFGNAVTRVSRSMGSKLRDRDVEVEARVGILPNETGGFALTVALDVAISGVDQASAEKIVEAAHAVCPYSNAVRDNVDVAIVVRAV
jgi:osmotically inducible protein OsmC